MAELHLLRDEHKDVIAFLSRLDGAFLENAQCYFGGGTRIVLELGEYRVSKDIDFLCASQSGYRKIREAVTDASLGALQKNNIKLQRSMRSDQYGIRSVICENQAQLKFEIIREGRIEIEGESVEGIPVKCLAPEYCFAEKFMANADRGVDTSTLNRDLIDLAFMAFSWPEELQSGYEIAERAYGHSVKRSLNTVIEKFKADKAHRNRCIEGLDIMDVSTLNKGLKKLASFL